MSAGPHVSSALVEMKKQQKEAADAERHLRAAQIYVRRTLSKALEGFDLESVDIDGGSVHCGIEVWIKTKENLERIMDAIQPDRSQWRVGPAGFSQRLTFQFCQGGLKGMIALGVYWILPPFLPDLEAAAMPQKQENH